MDNADRLKAFTKQLEKCQEEAAQTAGRHSMWKELRRVVIAAPWALQPPHIWQFITESHLQAVSLWVRRSVDCNDKSISIYKLIRRIACGEVRLTRNAYIAAILEGTESNDQEFWERRANEDFNKWAGPTEKHLPKETAKRHLDLLEQVCDPVSKYVDWRLAHHDKRQPDRVHIHQIDRAFSGIMAVHTRYHLMMTGENYPIGKPGMGFCLKEALETPWVVALRHEGLSMPLHPEGPGSPYVWSQKGSPGPWQQ